MAKLEYDSKKDEVYMNYINRSIEETIKRAGNSFKVVLVTGARQTGKSTVLKKMFNDIKYVTFDDEFLVDQVKSDPDTFMMLNEAPVFFDEIQYVPNLFRYIKMKVDLNDDRGQYYLSGSQPFRLMDIVSDSLAGRVAIIELQTLSLREITNVKFNKPFIPTMDYIKERSTEIVKPDNIWKIIHTGGYPELYSKNVDWNMFYASYIKTYLERDVRNLSSVQNIDDFRRFMIACASRTGQVLNYSNIASEIGKDSKTIKNWVSILEASGIVYLLEPYYNNTLNRAIKSPKLFFRDTGLCSYLLRWLTPETLANGAMNGALFETFVISEILKSYSNRGLDYRYFVSYYRGKDKNANKDNEIDFIIEQDGILYPIEIKLTANPKADMTSTFKILDSIEDKKRGTGAIICTCPTVSYLRENILSIPYFYI